MADKANVLLVGCGGIGTISALNLEIGGRATVTAVLRSNYDAVQAKGFHIRSVDHGLIENFRPTAIRNTVPDIKQEGTTPFKYIVCTTKNVPDVQPTLVDIIRPAVTPGYSNIVLIQNGLNIERPVIKAYPENVVLSGVSFCGSHEISPGEIVHEDDDELYIGAFRNPSLDATAEDAAAQDFVARYGAGGKCKPEYSPHVGFTRWRKLMYNACLNSICAATGLDTGRLQLADGALDGLVRPAMEEIRTAAKACGHDLPAELVELMIRLDPIPMYNPPSMLVDIRKRRYCEFEVIVGEPLKEGAARGVPMPTLRVIYNILKAFQWKLKEERGLVEIPAPKDFTNTANGTVTE
ncbi:2-dehydropantoate 2-reductase family protein [Paecilomyces variotii]|uniref:2-dehydropantoate 2-reductase n=1 Tax=Byssochlamys spectabilis TaxID=264951 RepID=A0A443HKG5_BYSSP|nr:2-dehydropantoate 2-reductase family protein [Paecilomyces variotii]KAJ9359868.1 hypothetical protein DTO280E4_4546 [Paecilomyces variotii]RWQ92348.1 2-dehydropantoate 2-reductase family protein [Paecilomyces variotii]